MTWAEAGSCGSSRGNRICSSMARRTRSRGWLRLARSGPGTRSTTPATSTTTRSRPRRAAPVELVISDSNRRRVVSPARPRQSNGRTLAAGEPIPDDAPVLEPFGHGTAAQTVAVLDGAADLRSPFAPGLPQFPEHRPYAAFDGDPRTWWEADREVRNSSRWVEVHFDAPRDVSHVDLLPRREDRTQVTEVEVAGRRFAVEPGWNRLDLGLGDVSRLRVRVSERSYPGDLIAGPGALAEVRVPGLRIREALRPPTRLEAAAAAADAQAVTYLFQRTTADRPFRRQPSSPRDAASIPELLSVEPVLIREARDPELEMRRRVSPPPGRAWTADAWVSPAPDAPDEALDRLLGERGGTIRVVGPLRGRRALPCLASVRRRPPHRRGSGGRTTRGRAWVVLARGRPGQPARTEARQAAGAGEPAGTCAAALARWEHPAARRRLGRRRAPPGCRARGRGPARDRRGRSGGRGRDCRDRGGRTAARDVAGRAGRSDPAAATCASRRTAR